MVCELEEDPWEDIRRVSAAAPGTPLPLRLVEQGRAGSSRVAQGDMAGGVWHLCEAPGADIMGGCDRLLGDILVWLSDLKGLSLNAKPYCGLASSTCWLSLDQERGAHS